MTRQTLAVPGLHYLAPEALPELMREHRNLVLGCLGFGRPAQRFVPRGLPYVTVDMPVVGADSVFEVWMGSEPVQYQTRGRLQMARDTTVLFACIEIPEDGSADYDALIYGEYCAIFDALDELGYPNLIRAWHYLPDIHRDEDALERYKRFSLGRHEAFVAKGRAISRDAPAASAVGKRAGSTVICVLAATRPGTPVENPRQISAYSYPAQYGPRGPTFSRALVTTWGGVRQLYVSGTASIFGHSSQHEGDAAAQADETLVNLRAVMDEARHHGLIDATGTEMLFKVYLRRPQLRPIVEERLRRAFGAAPAIVCLQADICRQELLLEIEVVCNRRSPD